MLCCRGCATPGARTMASVIVRRKLGFCRVFGAPMIRSSPRERGISGAATNHEAFEQVVLRENWYWGPAALCSRFSVPNEMPSDSVPRGDSARKFPFPELTPFKSQTPRRNHRWPVYVLTEIDISPEPSQEQPPPVKSPAGKASSPF